MLAVKDVLRLHSDHLQRLPHAAATRRHGEADWRSDQVTCSDAACSGVSILEILVHSAVLRQQLQLLQGLLMATHRSSGGGAMCFASRNLPSRHYLPQRTAHIRLLLSG